MRYAAAIGATWLALLSLRVAVEAGTVIEPSVPQPIQVRIEGYVGEKPPALVPEVSWVVGCRGRTYAFHVSHIQVLTGDVSPTNIVTAAEPYRTTFYLHGDAAALTRFASTSPGEKIVLIGYLRTGSRQLLIGRIEAAEVRTPTP